MPDPPRRHRSAWCPGRRHSWPDDRESSAARGYDGEWQRIRAAFVATHPICCDPYGRHPGEERSTAAVDHIVPLAAGGTHDAANLQPLCWSCHSHKTSTRDGGLGHQRRSS